MKEIEASPCPFYLGIGPVVILAPVVQAAFLARKWYARGKKSAARDDRAGGSAYMFCLTCGHTMPSVHFLPTGFVQ